MSHVLCDENNKISLSIVRKFIFIKFALSKVCKLFQSFDFWIEWTFFLKINFNQIGFCLETSVSAAFDQVQGLLDRVLNDHVVNIVSLVHELSMVNYFSSDVQINSQWVASLILEFNFVF